MDSGRIFTKYNTDTNGNPISIHVIKRHQVSPIWNGFILDFIPDRRMGVRILEPESLYEVYNSDELVEGTYYVEYSSGKIFFDNSMAAKEILVEYYDVGVEMISANRVYTVLDSKCNVVTTLGDIIRDSKTVIDALTTVGDVLIVVEELKENIKNAENAYNRLGTMIDEITQLLNNISSEVEEGKTILTNLTNKNNEANQTITNSETAKIQLQNKITESGTSLTNLTNKNEEVKQTIIDAESSGESLNQINETAKSTIVKANEANDKLNQSIGSADIDGMKNSIDINARNIQTNTNNISTNTSDIAKLKEESAARLVDGNSSKGYEEYKTSDGRIWVHEFGKYNTSSGGGVRMARIESIITYSANVNATTAQSLGISLDGTDVIRFYHSYSGNLWVTWHAWGYKKITLNE